MDMGILTPDFKEFIKLLNSHKVDYLIIGGYAVGYHGYVRATADIDIWIPINTQTAEKMENIVHKFGFDDPKLNKELFLKKENIIQMGKPPFRIDVITSISGVSFEECYPKRIIDKIDGIKVNIIDLENLRKSKKAAGRDKDLVDLKRLPK
jgi:predicted nucleotidyltransferase